MNWQWAIASSNCPASIMPSISRLYTRRDTLAIAYSYLYYALIFNIMQLDFHDHLRVFIIIFVNPEGVLTGFLRKTTLQTPRFFYEIDGSFIKER